VPLPVLYDVPFSHNICVTGNRQKTVFAVGTAVVCRVGRKRPVRPITARSQRELAMPGGKTQTTPGCIRGGGGVSRAATWTSSTCPAATDRTTHKQSDRCETRRRITLSIQQLRLVRRPSHCSHYASSVRRLSVCPSSAAASDASWYFEFTTYRL